MLRPNIDDQSNIPTHGSLAHDIRDAIIAVLAMIIGCTALDLSLDKADQHRQQPAAITSEGQGAAVSP